MRIILVCSNGISSGVFARRLRKLAEDRGDMELNLSSAGYESFRKAHDYDLVLIAPIGDVLVGKTIKTCQDNNLKYLVIDNNDYQTINAENVFSEILKQTSIEGVVQMNNFDSKALESIAMQLISKGGEARSLAMEAVFSAKEGDFEQADELLEKSEEALTEGHTKNAELLWAEANKTDIKLSILLIHSLDHIMNAQTVVEMARELVDVYRNRKG